MCVFCFVFLEYTLCTVLYHPMGAKTMLNENNEKDLMSAVTTHFIKSSLFQTPGNLEIAMNP